MTELDLELPGEAVELIDEFGKDIVYSRVSESTYDPATGGVTKNSPPLSVKAIVQADTGQSVKYGGLSLKNGLVETADFIVTIAADALGFEPSTGDTVAFDGHSYTVDGVKTFYSGELPVIYMVFVNG